VFLEHQSVSMKDHGRQALCDGHLRLVVLSVLQL
jgi:hypothetical protein